MAIQVMSDSAGFQTTLGRFWYLGFRLEFPDDHVMLLLHENERIAMFSQTGSSAESIQKECARWLLESDRHC